MVQRILALVVVFASLSMAGYHGSLASGQAATSSLRDLALGLARAGRATGVVVSFSEFEAINSVSGLPVPVGPARLERELAVFGKRHAEFAIEPEEQAVRLISGSAPREILESLKRPGSLSAPLEMSASAAVNHGVAYMLRQYKVMGILGSGQTPGPGCPLGAPVRLEPGPTTPLKLLDAIVLQVPGLAWLVVHVDGTADQLKVGLWCPDGMYFLAEV